MDAFSVLNVDMVSLPLVIILSAVLLPILLEERFKFITTFLGLTLGVVLSFASQPIVKSFTAASDSWENNAAFVSMIIFLIVSIFIFSNNIAHKIFVTLLLYLNYVFISDSALAIMKISIAPQGGSVSSFVINGSYILFSLVIAILLVNPLKFFYRREVSYTSIVCCVLVVIGIIFSDGIFNEFFKIDSSALRFYPTLFIYLMLVFCLRSVFTAAKYRIKDNEQLHESEMDRLFADNFDVMLACAERIEQDRVKREKELLGIRKLLETEDKDKVFEYVTMLLKKLKKQKSKFAYGNNPYISSVIAAKADVAAAENIFVDGNIEINDIDIDIHELCMIVDELLTALILDSRNENKEEKFIRLTGIDTDKKLVLEAVSSFNEVEKTKITKRSLYDFIKILFEKKETRVDNFARIKKYVAEHSGSLNISAADGEKITRIEINF